MRRRIALTAAAALALAACGTDTPEAPESTPAETPTAAATDDETAEPAETETAAAPEEPAEAPSPPPAGPPVTDFDATEHATFDEPWALEFLPGTDYLAVTERGGAIKLRNQATGDIVDVDGVPDVHHAGQAGVHDLIVAPSFEDDGAVYLSWVQHTGQGPHGVVARGTLDVDAGALTNLATIWEQDVTQGNGHFSLRMVIQGDHLYLTSGDRQDMDPAQDHGSNLGKILRLALDGTPAEGNPFGDEGVESSFWSIGHRNPLGIALDVDGNLWSSEMGPQGGDELNYIVAGENYGWPEASMGIHYNDRPITDHTDGDGFRAPAAYWVPSISPGNLMIYRGELFTGWYNNAIIGGLSGQNLTRLTLDGESAEVADEWNMGARIRAVEEAPDGAIWVA
ncbi:MAG: PQQ-dependent sugar dehydrogenase [Propionibacterium sp.]|nr:PQQ-dependent sugar dehydrogenase [Propionibacterium sp.]